MNKLTKVSLIASLLVGASFSATADDFIPTNISATLERNISAQMQEMMTVAQRELSLSVQAQLSESLFDSSVEQQALSVAEASNQNDETVITSAMVKE
ncbi:hypothetical protein TUM4644_04140 [Shewanella colwelliana]|uniref:Uncharacterized protein n=1 Tax=Shewanella colwelliana TaxID=23 RepID=A0A1E5IWW2_SHECO|nr:hypothetical protein [Shewanella colwelliana]MDX1282580.1 hypothetical protein [Shewanella colwelliana]OEG74994.1 hypothetical protein BEL05_12560 [Shewanella colwelliana]GIU18090.1 hypothetical protein TUM4644_04140 [Shewanella colwelliana]GIU36709.1 hypothetical protein TUM3794_06230 [Shewanella colwelliana]